MFRYRLLTAVVGIPAGLLLIYAGGWRLAAAAALLAIGGLSELYRLLAARERLVYARLGYALACVLLAATAMVPAPRPAFGSLAVEAGLVVIAMAAAGRWLLARSVAPTGRRLFDTLAAQIYVPQMLSYLLRLRAVPGASIALGSVLMPAGACWTAAVMVVVWGMDTAAYGVGKVIGRRKLCPTISPGKTVEGAVAALAAAGALTAGAGHWLGLPLVHGVVLGMMLGVVGQGGDLFESALKRAAGVKDSGALLPGHGGLLDRFDSLIFVAPVAYYYLAEVFR
jgi:phosphatidate cytidylyltransferase